MFDLGWVHSQYPARGKTQPARRPHGAATYCRELWRVRVCAGDGRLAVVSRRGRVFSAEINGHRNRWICYNPGERYPSKSARRGLTWEKAITANGTTRSRKSRSRIRKSPSTRSERQIKLPASDIAAVSRTRWERAGASSPAQPAGRLPITPACSPIARADSLVTMINESRSSVNRETLSGPQNL